MPSTYDTIVVGARCAGSATAMLLARGGQRVLLVDRDEFPSDTLSTHYIHQPGVERLRKWGVLDRIIESNCPPIRSLRFDVGPFALEGAPAPAGASTDGFAPRRRILDQILIDAAVASGVEFRPNFSVRELLTADGRVTGIRGAPAGAVVVDELARLIIGADGMRSFVARSVAAPIIDQSPALTCAYYTYWSGVPASVTELYVRPQQSVILAPTNDGETLTIVYWPVARFPGVRTDIPGHFWTAVETIPGLANRLRAGTQAERFRGTADLPFFVRKAAGPGWALAGDAAIHRDPITAEGITAALRDAELLAAAVLAAPPCEQPLDDALEAYDQQRLAAAMPMYEFTRQLAALEPPAPEMQALFGALRTNPHATSQFFGVIAGTVPFSEFFDPGNMGRILATPGVPD